MTIASILRDRESAVISATTGMKVRDVVALLAEKRIGAVPVIDDAGAAIGIFSERDVIYRLHSQGAALLDLSVEEVMTTPAVTVEPGLPILNALALMTKRRIRHLPVVEGERVTGFVSIGDLVKARIDRIESDAAAMRDYIAGS